MNIVAQTACKQTVKTFKLKISLKTLNVDDRINLIKNAQNAAGTQNVYLF